MNFYLGCAEWDNNKSSKPLRNLIRLLVNKNLDFRIDDEPILPPTRRRRLVYITSEQSARAYLRHLYKRRRSKAFVNEEDNLIAEIITLQVRWGIEEVDAVMGEDTRARLRRLGYRV